eukprot:266402-Alexandrium_andersonii.AAC.1
MLLARGVRKVIPPFRAAPGGTPARRARGYAGPTTPGRSPDPRAAPMRRAKRPPGRRPARPRPPSLASGAARAGPTPHRPKASPRNAWRRSPRPRTRPGEGAGGAEDIAKHCWPKGSRPRA